MPLKQIKCIIDNFNFKLTGCFDMQPASSLPFSSHALKALDYQQNWKRLWNSATIWLKAHGVSTEACLYFHIPHAASGGMAGMAYLCRPYRLKQYKIYLFFKHRLTRPWSWIKMKMVMSRQIIMVMASLRLWQTFPACGTLFLQAKGSISPLSTVQLMRWSSGEARV